MSRNYEAFKGGGETEIEQKRNCRGFRNQKGRGVPLEWPSFALLAHQIAAFSFFFPRPFNGFVHFAARVRGSLGSC